MLPTDEKYKRITASEPHWFDVSVTVGESGRLVDRSGDVITFGSDRILVDTGGPDGGLREDELISVKTTTELFGDVPTVGKAISAELDLEMVALSNIPKRARIGCFVRASNGVEQSSWLPQGVYYIDTREYSRSVGGHEVLKIHAYDAMLMAEVSWPSNNLGSPVLDTDLVQFVADNLRPSSESKAGISVDSRTWQLMDKRYKFSNPIGYSLREVLCMIAAAYGGNFIITQAGELRLISMFDLPPETRYLITQDGYAITFGGDRIVV